MDEQQYEDQMLENNNEKTNDKKGDKTAVDKDQNKIETDKNDE